MKKVFSVLMVVVALMVAAPAQAQLVKFGLKGGMDVTKLDFNFKTASEVADNTAGWFIGPMAEVTLPLVGLGVDGAVMFTQKGKGDFKQQGIQVPLNLKYTIGLGSMFGIYVAAGPDFFFNFKDAEAIFVVDDMLFKEKASKKKNQVAINLGAGLKLLKKLQVGVTYQIPMGNSYEWEDTFVDYVVTAKNKTWQVSLAYIF